MPQLGHQIGVLSEKFGTAHSPSLSEGSENSRTKIAGHIEAGQPERTRGDGRPSFRPVLLRRVDVCFRLAKGRETQKVRAEAFGLTALDGWHDRDDFTGLNDVGALDIIEVGRQQ